MRSPITWFGGKGAMAAKLRGYLHAPHTTYVEVFGGGASLLFDRAPAPVEVYNDLDGRLTNLFRVLQDPDLFEVFRRRIEAIPRGKRHWEAARCLSSCPAVGEVTRAAAFFVLARQSFGGIPGNSWGATVGSTSGGQAQSTSAWRNTVNRLPEIHDRLLRVQIDNADFRKLIRHYDRPETLFYLDPPYLPETRRDGGYACELTAADHRELLALVAMIEGMAMISGYPSDLYDQALGGWRRDEFRVTAKAQGNTRAIGNQGSGGLHQQRFQRTEVVWMNPRLAERVAALAERDRPKPVKSRRL